MDIKKYVSISSQTPLISIVTPSYNQGEYIEDTIRSVLAQDYPRVQYIVVDGCSIDKTSQVLTKYKDKLELVVEPDEGQVDALTKGFTRAKGNIVTWLNSDDVYTYKDTLSRIANLFNSHPNISVVSGSTVLIDSNNKLLQVFRAIPKFSYRQLLLYDYIRQPATFIRSDALQNNSLDKSLNCAFDYDLWLKLAKDNEFMMVRDILAGIRRHMDMKTIRLAEDMDKESAIVRNRYGYLSNVSSLDRLNGILIRAINKIAGLRLVAGIYRHADKQSKKMAISITVDSLVCTCSRQLFNHKGLLF